MNHPNKQKASRGFLATLALILSLAPLAVDALYFVIAMLNRGNWAYIILALFVLPAVHFLFGIGGLVSAIMALVKKQSKVSAYIALVLSGLYVLLSCAIFRRFLFN